MIQIKRAYDEVSRDDGFRILVDRLWPRGLSKEKLKIGLWLKEIAPSPELRKSFGHDPDKWDWFRTSYLEELKEKSELISSVKKLEQEKGKVTLVYAAKDKKHNNAVVLQELVK
jgi:uncharacterized protein YeaO (DUF488 family)